MANRCTYGTCSGLYYVITLHDRSTQTSDVIKADSASSPARQPRRHLYTWNFKPEGTSDSQSKYFRLNSDDDEETGSELPLPACSRCGAGLIQHGRYRRALREITPRPPDDVMKPRDRRATALRSRTHDHPTEKDAAAAANAHQVMITKSPSLSEMVKER